MKFSSKVTLGAAAVALLALPISAAHAESLKSALTAAYAHNPTIRAALASVKVAAENIALRRATVLPNVGAAVSITDTGAASGGTFTNSQQATAGLSYSQTLYDNHKTDANVEQARALVQVANQSLRTAESNVLLSAVQAYMNVILNTQLVTLRTDTVQFYQTQVKASQDRLNIGEGTKIDVAQAQASLASSIALQKSAIAGLQTAQGSYVHWVGHKPSNLSSDFNYGTLIPATVDRAMQLAGSYNPSILSAKASIRAAQAGLDAANASFGPSVGLTGQVGPTFSSVANDTDSLSVAGSVKLSLSLPVYAGGALGAASRQANQSQIESTLNAQAARDQVNDSVVTAFASLQNAAAQIDAAKSGVEAGNLALQGVVQERDVGQKTTLDVLNAESVLTASRESLITASANRVIASFALVAAIGKMSPQDLGLRTPQHSAQNYTARVEDTWEEVRSLE